MKGSYYCREEIIFSWEEQNWLIQIHTPLRPSWITVYSTANLNVKRNKKHIWFVGNVRQKHKAVNNIQINSKRRIWNKENRSMNDSTYLYYIPRNSKRIKAWGLGEICYMCTVLCSSIKNKILICAHFYIFCIYFRKFAYLICTAATYSYLSNKRVGYNKRVG